MNPYVALALVAGLGVTHWLAYDHGKDTATQACEARVSATNEAFRQIGERRRADAAAQAAATAKRLDALEVRRRDLQQEVNRYARTAAAADRCFDPVGVRIWNAISTGGGDPVRRDPDGTVESASPAAGDRQPG